MDKDNGKVREYRDADRDILVPMLLDGGIEEDEIGVGVDGYRTWVMDGVGFFTLGETRGRPFLVHFCVKRENRSPLNFRRLVTEAKRIIGHGKEVIIGVPISNDYLRRFVYRYCKTKPYGKLKSNIYFLAEV
jgi:hypothetical protein